MEKTEGKGGRELVKVCLKIKAISTFHMILFVSIILQNNKYLGWYHNLWSTNLRRNYATTRLQRKFYFNNKLINYKKYHWGKINLCPF